MNIEDVKDLFKQKYQTFAFELVDENNEELFFKHHRRTIFRAGKEELDSYAQFELRRNDYSINPNECSMVSSNYREQVMSSSRYRAMAGYIRNNVLTFGDSTGENIWCEIGEASADFKNFFRFQESYFDYSISKSRYSNSFRIDEEQLHNTMFSPTTIKIYNIGASSPEAAIDRSNTLIDSVLFTLSYTRDMILQVEENWPRRMQKNLKFTFGETNGDRDLPLPKSKLLPNLVRFYQRAMLSDDPVNAFLSFYHCLEYFFVTVSEELLYQKLTRRISDPKFQLKPRHLDRIIQDTLDHKRESDETEMLKSVLGKYVEPTELIEFIKSYEKFLGDSRFTKKRKLFGEDSEVKLIEGHVLGNVASRIKSIRNSLVHSSDRYKRQDIFVPTTQNELIIQLELPLVKYLAERIVIGSSSI